MNKMGILLSTAALVCLLASPVVYAQDSNAELLAKLESMQQQIDELRQQLAQTQTQAVGLGIRFPKTNKGQRPDRSHCQRFPYDHCMRSFRNGIHSTTASGVTEPRTAGPTVRNFELGGTPDLARRFAVGQAMGTIGSVGPETTASAGWTISAGHASPLDHLRILMHQ